jgi:tetratricopeptide (TPR) repeat protein
VTLDGGAQSHNVLGFVLLAQKKFEEAKAALDEALRLNPEGHTNLRVFAETLLYRGLVERGKGDAAAAKQSFERAANVQGGGRFSKAALREASTLDGEGAPA